MWAKGVKPGQFFDAKASSPALTWAVDKGLFSPSSGPPGPALVPGCGRGYDVATLARLEGVSLAVGLELSTTATEAASEYLREQGLDAARARVVTQDLFKVDAEAIGGPFGCAFDYTCFCAIDVADRPSWAKAYARLIRPGGRLVCLQFPLAAPERTKEELEAADGPPFPLHDSLYDEVLIPAGFRKVQRDEVPEDKSHPGRGGREALATYERL